VWDIAQTESKRLEASWGSEGVTSSRGYLLVFEERRKELRKFSLVQAGR